MSVTAWCIAGFLGVPIVVVFALSLAWRWRIHRTGERVPIGGEITDGWI